jgi:hypothetical protein
MVILFKEMGLSPPPATIVFSLFTVLPNAYFLLRTFAPHFLSHSDCSSNLEILLNKWTTVSHEMDGACGVPKGIDLGLNKGLGRF